MIVRDYVACKTCGNVHITRIQLGYGDSQEHAFHCVKCNEPMKVIMYMDQDRGSWNLDFIDNCTRSEKSTGTPVYLSSDIIANKDKINDEFYFPSFDLMKQMLSSPEGASLLSRDLTGGRMTPLGEWSNIQKSWRLENSGQHKLASKFIVEYSKRHGLIHGVLSENIRFFLNFIFPQNVYFRNEVLSISSKNNFEFLRFLHFYSCELREKHRRSQFSLLNSYFDCFNEHSQVYTYLKTGAKPPVLAKATSVNFSLVKEFYAKVYEFFSAQIGILTCLNNIKAGRPFDQLQSIGLAKYLKDTDKAKRRDSVFDNKIFCQATEEFDSQIRNASYHDWFFIRPDNETIEYRSGGTGVVQIISYTDYLFRCGSIFRQMINLMDIEFEFDLIVGQLNAVRQ